MANTPASADEVPERRQGRRRTYNRRQSDEQPAPPYFEAFERIAVALEHIEQLLRERPLALPDEPSRRDRSHAGA